MRLTGWLTDLESIHISLAMKLLLGVFVLISMVYVPVAFGEVVPTGLSYQGTSEDGKAKLWNPPPDWFSIFLETFDPTWTDRWSLIRTDHFQGTFEVAESDQTKGGIPHDTLFRTAKGTPENPQVNAFYGAVAQLKEELDLISKGEELILQFDVRQTKNVTCAGAYVKLMVSNRVVDEEEEQRQRREEGGRLHESYPSEELMSEIDMITKRIRENQERDRERENRERKENMAYPMIVFGPDRCYEDRSAKLTNHRVRFQIHFRNPKTLQITQHEFTRPPAMAYDDLTHLFALRIKPDGRFWISVDMKAVANGELLNPEDFDPPIQPRAMIDDPKALPPLDWAWDEFIPDPLSTPPPIQSQEPEYIVDTDAEIPGDWLFDAPEKVPDPNAKKPEEWDEELDGPWMPPMIANPECASGRCGEWKAPLKKNPNFKGNWEPKMINNPAYKGRWTPPVIINPAYYEVEIKDIFRPVGAVGLDIFVSAPGVIEYDNILLTNNHTIADSVASYTWLYKANLEYRVFFKRGGAKAPSLIDTFKENPFVSISVIAAVVLVLATMIITSPKKEKQDPNPISNDVSSKKGESTKKPNAAKK